MTIAGRMVSVMKASTSCQYVMYSPWYSMRPSGQGYFRRVLRTTSGRRKLFQLVTKAMIATVDRIGRDKGRMIEKKMRDVAAPVHQRGLDQLDREAAGTHCAGGGR